MQRALAPAGPGAVPSRAVDPQDVTTSTSDLRHNVAALGADYALFLVGLSFASQSTILPAFATHLGASNLVIGAIPALMTLGWFLPSLLAAHHTRTLPRKLPFVLRYTGAERVPFLVLAVLAFTVAERAPMATLALMLVMLLVITGTGGALMPAWMEIIARRFPCSCAGGSSACGAAWRVRSASWAASPPHTSWVPIAAPASYGVCFLAAAACMGLSWIALALVRELPRPPCRSHWRCRGSSPWSSISCARTGTSCASWSPARSWGWPTCRGPSSPCMRCAGWGRPRGRSGSSRARCSWARWRATVRWDGWPTGWAVGPCCWSARAPCSGPTPSR